MYRGIIPPLITPIQEDGTLCEGSIYGLISHLRPYISGLMPALSSGEGWRLSERQWIEMVSYTKKYAGDLPVFAGILLGTTQEVIARGRLAQKMELQAIVVTAPFDKGISQEAIYEHYKEIRKAIEIPIFVYNEGAVSGNSILPETLFKIFELPGIVGIKESSGSIEVTRELIGNKAGVPVFQGWENLCLVSGAVDGYVLPLSNIEPKLCFEMFNSPTPDKQKEMELLCKKHGLFQETWYASLKRELKRRGLISSERVLS